MKTTHSRIKKIRKQLGFRTAKEFAPWIHEDLSLIQNYEAGYSTPNPNFCIRMALGAKEDEDKAFFLELAGFTPEEIRKLFVTLYTLVRKDISFPGQYALPGTGTLNTGADRMVMEESPPGFALFVPSECIPRTEDEVSVVKKLMNIMRSGDKGTISSITQNLVTFDELINLKKGLKAGEEETPAKKEKTG
jgi:hypothetical protein